MSGGVDSSVAAALLQRAGHEVFGVFMRLMTRTGQADAAAAKAERAAEGLGIPLHVADLTDEFGEVIDYFVAEYSSARTPNPCIVCNAKIKFGALWRFAQSLGAEKLATGHHARIIDAGTHGASLCRGRDEGKDQSYFLFGIERDVLPHLIFPVGDYEKTAIRRMAAELGLAAAESPESQDICFLADSGVSHAAFVQDVLSARGEACDNDRGGEIVTADGRVVGRHDGIERFTVGQRKGIGVALGEPYFVTRIDAATRQVVLGRREQLACGELVARGANWLVDPPGETFRAEVKIRYRSRPTAAAVDIISPGEFRVRFESPCYGAAPGQAAVCYDGDKVLGGGWIA